MRNEKFVGELENFIFYSLQAKTLTTILTHKRVLLSSVRLLTCLAQLLGWFSPLSSTQSHQLQTHFALFQTHHSRHLFATIVVSINQLSCLLFCSLYYILI